MREKVVVTTGKRMRIDQLACKYRWIQIDYDVGDNRVLDGKYHPKLTFFYIGNQNGSITYREGQDYACNIDLYGANISLNGRTLCRMFPMEEQLFLMEEYGEVLLGELTENEILKITQEIGLKSKV